MRQGVVAPAMLLAAGWAAAAVLLIGGCSGPAPPSPAPPRPVTLSTSDSAANVGAVVTLFRQTCLDAAPDERRLAAAVAASGWPVREMRVDTPGEPSVWRFDHGQMHWLPMRSKSECFLTLDSLVAPTPTALSTALRPFVQRADFQVLTEEEGRVVWAWPAGGNRRVVLTIHAVPASPGRTYGAGRQPVSLQITREPMPAASADRE
jgi:hypothetical protein